MQYPVIVRFPKILREYRIDRRTDNGIIEWRNQYKF